MLLAALVVGLVTAWSFGPRAGMTTAGVAFGLFVVAALIPPISLYIHIAVAVGVAGLAATAVRRPRHPLTVRALDLGRLLLKRLRSQR